MQKLKFWLIYNLWDWHKVYLGDGVVCSSLFAFLEWLASSREE